MDTSDTPISSADEPNIGPPSGGVHQESAAGETILYLEDADMVVTLNETGSAIWERCDGTRSAGAIATELATLYEMEPSSIRNDVDALIAQLTEAGFLP